VRALALAGAAHADPLVVEVKPGDARVARRRARRRRAAQAVDPLHVIDHEDLHVDAHINHAGIFQSEQRTE
jgi:hypothetical protein